MDNYLPLVSVPVITYNSSKTVLETLDSIYNQTYPNLELIISDDGSSDNTVAICKKWVKQNESRFVRTQLISMKKNQGTSANLNRAESLCRGEWVKGVSGDDRLLPNCIADFINFIESKPEAIYVFGRIQAFGADLERCKHYEEDVFCPSFFDLNEEEQLEKLIFEGNNIPAVTCFYNRLKVIQLGIRNDERIPLLEDWPKWINVLKKKIKLFYLDKQVVQYRLSGVSTSGLPSKAFQRSMMLFEYYYLYPERLRKYPDETILQIVDELVKAQTDLENVRNSFAYRIGKKIMKPLGIIRKQFRTKQFL